MYFTTSRSLWCSSTFLFPICWCTAKCLWFLVTSQKTQVSYSATLRGTSKGCNKYQWRWISKLNDGMRGGTLQSLQLLHLVFLQGKAQSSKSTTTRLPNDAVYHRSSRNGCCSKNTINIRLAYWTLLARQIRTTQKWMKKVKYDAPNSHNFMAKKIDSQIWKTQHAHSKIYTRPTNKKCCKFKV